VLEVIKKLEEFNSCKRDDSSDGGEIERSGMCVVLYKWRCYGD
jgi:hypothetical protein